MTTKTINQNEYILAHLKAYGKITQGEATDYYGVTRLSARIKDLRYLYGQDAIRTEKVPFTHWFTGHAGSYARYVATRQLKRRG
jgi:hypothetical protein